MSAILGSASSASSLLSYYSPLHLRDAKQSGPKPTDQGTSATTADPVDTVAAGALATGLAAGNASGISGSLANFLTQAGSQNSKQDDAKQLKDAVDQLHLLELLGSSLPPEKLAKETTDLAKKIAGIAKDYASTSSAGQPSAAALATTANPADTAASTATAAADTAAGTTQSADTGTEATADKAASAATSDATQPSSDAKTAAQSAATTAQAAGGTDPSTADAAAGTAASGSPSDSSSANAEAFFSEAFGALKDLKKLETGALEQIAASPDPKLRAEGKKFGSAFNSAVAETNQAAAASGLSAGLVAQLSPGAISPAASINITA
jgi:hypothetical protein